MRATVVTQVRENGGLGQGDCFENVLGEVHNGDTFHVEDRKEE